MNSPEHLSSPDLGEYPKLPIYYLPEQLGFTETPPMVAARKELVEAMQANDREQTKTNALAYHLMGEEIVEAQPDPEAINAARVGLNISMALVRRDAGRTEDYQEDLYDILPDLDGLIASGREEFEPVAIEIEEALDNIS